MQSTLSYPTSTKFALSFLEFKYVVPTNPFKRPSVIFHNASICLVPQAVSYLPLQVNPCRLSATAQ
jgi:hypothetical protein